MANPIGNLGTIPSMTVGGRVFTDLTTLIILMGPVSTAGRYTSMRKMNGTAGYAVTSGKTLTTWAVRVANTATGVSVIQVLYGDNDVGFNSASAPTTPIYAGGFSGASSQEIVVQGSVASSGAYQNLPEVSLNFQVPQTKIPAVLIGNVAGCLFGYGYET